MSNDFSVVVWEPSQLWIPLISSEFSMCFLAISPLSEIGCVESSATRRGAGRVIGVALITVGGGRWGEGVGPSCCVRVSSDHPAGPNASGPGGWRLFITADLLATRRARAGRRPKLVRAKLKLQLCVSVRTRPELPHLQHLQRRVFRCYSWARDQWSWFPATFLAL